jgi:hypothetical protein
MGVLIVILVAVAVWAWWGCSVNKADPRAKRWEEWRHFNEQARMHPTLYRGVSPPRIY